VLINDDADDDGDDYDDFHSRNALTMEKFEHRGK